MADRYLTKSGIERSLAAGIALADALVFATEKRHADLGRFVGSGLIQLEYADYLRSGKARTPK
jgi:hypothetical protein